MLRARADSVNEGDHAFDAFDARHREEAAVWIPEPASSEGPPSDRRAQDRSRRLRVGKRATTGRRDDETSTRYPGAAMRWVRERAVHTADLPASRVGEAARHRGSPEREVRDVRALLLRVASGSHLRGESGLTSALLLRLLLPVPEPVLA